MTALLLIGRGGHALSCLDVIRSAGKFQVIGYVDREAGGAWEGIPSLGTDADLPRLLRDCPQVFLGVGQIGAPQLRRRLVDQLRAAGAQFPCIVSPKAHVAESARLGEGTIVMHGAHVGPAAQVGAFNILNTRSLVEHGCRTGDFVHVSTAAVVNGDVTVGENVFVGSNSVLCHGITVPSGVFVQAGQFIGRKHVW